MFDNVKKNLNPGALRKERDDLQATLEALQLQMEDERLAAGRAAIALNSAGSLVTEKEVRSLREKHDATQAKVAELRARRRELDELLLPPPAFPEFMVPQPADLIAAQAALDEARKERRELLPPEDAELNLPKAQRHNARIRELEDRIEELKANRDRAEAPWLIATRKAMRPQVRSAAIELQEALDRALAALSVLQEASGKLPVRPEMKRMGNGLEPLMFLNRRELVTYRDHAKQLAEPTDEDEPEGVAK